MIATMRATADDGVPVQARYAGEGAQAIVFVHGVGSTAEIWDGQLRAFADRYRCFAVELRGNGVVRPDPPPEAIGREGFARDVLAIAGAAGLTRFHLVGCSLGGVVALELWRLAAQRLASLTFVGSYAAYPQGAAYAQAVARAVREAGSMEVFARERTAKLGLPPHREQESIAQMACKSVASYLAATEATWTGDYRATLALVNVPTLVAVGERDTVAPPELAREIARGIAGARYAVVPQAGHVANADAPEAFNALLASFLEGLS